MQRSRLIVLGPCFAALLSLVACTHASSDPTGTGGSGDTGGSNGPGTAGTTGTGGTTGVAGTNGSGTGGSLSTAGTNGSGTAGNNSAGSAGRGGTTGTAGTNGSGTGGSVSTAGTTGTAGNNSAGSAGHGGTTGTAGATGTAGSTTGTAGATGTGGTGGTTIVDQGGVPLAKVGDMTNVSTKYLNLGDIRLINNRWGSDALNCTGTQQSVFVNSDRTVGYSFNRPTCGGARADPDFPELEFGVAPFGTASSLLTSPPYSSTTLLPIQIKDLQSATVNIDTFATSFQNPTYWDNNFEFWISKNDPRTSADAGVYAEIIMFTGWQSNRLSSTGGWPCDVSGSVTAGSTSYNLCHQRDDWSTGHWRFFNFNIASGPFTSLSTTADVKAILNWIMSKYSGFTTDMWLTRIEVGTEVDDMTQGTAKIKNLTFTINGTAKSIQLAN
jgi:hypothetical protein